jgi:hypothetical protein
MVLISETIPVISCQMLLRWRVKQEEKGEASDMRGTGEKPRVATGHIDTGFS